MSIHPGSLNLTPNEAGFVLGRSSTSINKAVDEGIIEAKVVGRGAVRSRVLGPTELRFLKLSDSLQRHFTTAGRRSLYLALKGVGNESPQVKLGPMQFDLRPVDLDIAARLKRLDTVRSSVVGHGLGEPLIRGTTVFVYVIAGLSRGQTVAEIGEDYPDLTSDQIELAIEYARAYPKRGRPHPARSFKRSLADLALHDLPIERTRGGPRRIDP